jgi:hypothetical protein
VAASSGARLVQRPALVCAAPGCRRQTAVLVHASTMAPRSPNEVSMFMCVGWGATRGVQTGVRYGPRVLSHARSVPQPQAACLPPRACQSRVVLRVSCAS